jgi:voltage-gated potassium channel
VPDEDRLARWERRTGAPLTVLGALFLAAYAVRVLRPGLSPAGHTVVSTVEYVTWAALAVDLVVRLRLAADRRRFLRTHVFDLVVLALPMIRPLRVLRVLSLLLMVHRRVTRAGRLRLSVYVGGTTALIIFVASLAVLDAERRAPGSNIHSYLDALWWTMTTVSTVGYGDHFPVTVEGRLLAMGLMVVGIGLLGFVTGSLASWFIDQFSELQESEEETREGVADLVAEVRALRAEIAALRADRAA